MQDVNCLKIVLVEQNKTNKWLSEEPGVSPSTFSSGVLIPHNQISKFSQECQNY